MAKRTAISAARSLVVVLTLFVGILFAGHNFAFAQATDSVSLITESNLSESLGNVDDFLTGQTGVENQSTFSDSEIDQSVAQESIVSDDSASSTDLTVSDSTDEDNAATSTAVGSTATSTESESSTEENATSSLPSLENEIGGANASSTGSTTPIGSASSTNATSTNNVELPSSNPIDNSTSTQATSTGQTSSATSTEAAMGGGADSNASSTLKTLLVSDLTTASSSDQIVASSTASTTQSFRVKYYRYDEARTDMAGWGIPFGEIEGIDPGDPLATSWTKDWFSAGFLKKTVTESNVQFKDRFTPFAESTDPLADPESHIAAPNFGAHFMGIATVTEEKDYTLTITTDGDVWFYLDKVLQAKNLSGIKPAETITQTIHMVPGQQYVLNMFFTERIALYPYFDFSFPGVTITPCDSDSCDVPVLDADTSGPSVPEIVSPIPPTSSTDLNISIPITWTESTDPEISGSITSGLRGYIYVWDQSSTTVPSLANGTLTSSTSTVITNLSAGMWWFHVVAIDNAGNISEPTTHHGPFCIGLSSCDSAEDSFQIINLRATDVTSHSVVIRWKTINFDGSDHPANSRVIYDTISHSILGEAPNYGYAYSTATSNDDPKVVEHAVTISGLLANTTYYFRAVSQGSPTVVSGELGGGTDDNGNGEQNDGPTQPIVISSTPARNGVSSSTSANISWTTSTADNGLAGYSFLWSKNSSVTPDDIVDSTNTASSTVLTPGVWYFHIKAVDQKGLVSATTHYGPMTICDGSSISCGEGSVTTLPEEEDNDRGGHSSGSSVRKVIATSTPVLPASCKPYLLKFIKLGAPDNDPVEVKKLQLFLQVFEGRKDIEASGVYDLATYEAVKDFQAKYGLDVLSPWGIADSTGYVFITTSLKINYIYCGITNRITMNLRDIYPANIQFAQVDNKRVDLGMVAGTSTASTSIMLLLATEATSTKNLNYLHLAFAGIGDLFINYPCLWILLLLILVILIIWATRSKSDDDLNVTSKENKN